MKFPKLPMRSMFKGVSPSTAAGIVFTTALKLPLPPMVKVPVATVAAAVAWVVVLRTQPTHG